jgi:glycosyltransferase involved in cell wall biosynthesis
MGKTVSILLTVRNVEQYIDKCLTSILQQTFTDFEVILVDDLSNDKTKDIIEKFTDKRIRYFRNKELLGLSQSRNECVKQARGDFVFFTDGDCVVSPNWLQEGIKYLKTAGYVGVEGKTYYISKEYKPTRSDDVVENKTGELFMTCNIAYKKAIIERIGGFDKRFTYHEDRDLALRALKQGRIFFNPKMVVYHQKKTLTPIQFLKKGKILRNNVLLYKKSKERPLFIGRIVYPKDLLAIIFPPLIFTSLFRNVNKTKEDFALFSFIYIKLVYERLTLWDMCAKERVFLI